MKTDIDSKKPITEEELKEKIIKALKEQGFEIHSQLYVDNDKETFKQIQYKAKLKQLSAYKKFLQENLSLAQSYCRDGKEIEVDKISLELREVLPNTLEEKLFRWWTFIWWSMPYQNPIGRRMRFILWDITHNMPFGLIQLQSPPLGIKVRDEYLGIKGKEGLFWLNKSMNAQRLGALPPYNEILGGKMTTLAIVSNEIREAYERKYSSNKTIVRGIIENELLFLTTTSAFGRSSIYNRLKYNDEPIAISLGYTAGSGTFHIPDELYKEMLEFLSQKGISITKNLKSRCSKNSYTKTRKLWIISKVCRLLGIKNITHHSIQREVFLFPLVKNLKEVIKHNEEPIYYNRPFEKIVDYWKVRYAIPRAERKPEWREFKAKTYFEEVRKMLEEV